MLTKRGASRRVGLKKTGGEKKAGGQGRSDPPVLRLHLVGKIKRSEMRRAILAVREEKARMTTEEA